MELSGAMVAIVTPFDDDNQIDHDALGRLADRQIAGGITGIIVCGTTGEAATMSKDEQLAAVRTVKQAIGDRGLVVAGTGTNDTAETLRYTHKVAELGVDAALVVCPPYNKPSQRGMFAHFSAIAEVGLPVILYNVPGRTAVSLTPETIGKLSQVENVVAVKEATADMKFDTACLELSREGFAHLSGDDFTTFPYVAMGGDGCISVVANLAPRLMADLCAAAVAGDRDKGAALHRKVNRIAQLCFCDSNPVPSKAILAHEGLCRPHVRLPLAPLDEETQARVLAAWEREKAL